MATTSVWASLANAPPPPSSSEGPTLCEIQALLVTLQANLDVTKGNGATQLSTNHSFISKADQSVVYRC